MRQEFVPRPYQTMIIDHILRTPRCAVWAGMGTGKTVATLTALDALQMVEDGPVLVLAPLRVATSTWPDEVLKWQHLRGLNVSVITGTEKERIEAIKTPAHIYATNYEQLVWLVAYWGDRWPYATVVMDESTKVKSFRLRQGGKRAQALGSIAHTRIKRIVELTGTPASNGLKDLWGQAWFVDAGVRLGRTFTAFSQRWFATARDGFGLTPLPTAQKEIQDRLRDVCLTIEAKDWFDLRQPIVTNIEVTLPVRARKHYKDMEKEMFTSLDTGHEVEAFNAAAKTQKCIAQGTEILTRKRGWIPIEKFIQTDELWDGVEWVSALKLVCNGYINVIECFQVAMTADHKVLTDSGWLEAKDIKNDSAIVREKVRLPYSHSPSGNNAEYKSKKGALASALFVREHDNGDWDKPTVKKSGRQEIVWVQEGGNVIRGLGLPRHDGASRMDNMAQYAITLFKFFRQRLEKLRGTRDTSLRTVASRFFNLLARYVLNISTRIDNRTNRQLRELHTGKLPMGNSSGTSQQSTNKCSIRHFFWSNNYGSSGPSGGIKVRDTESPTSAGLVDRECTSPHKAWVYDLVNCGPRNRFTVRGKDGIPLIVHNCLQICNGAMYVGEGAIEWAELHKVKLEALDSIIEEASGMPVLVAYNFKSDLARLKKSFPQGRQLDKNPQTIKDWNAGKIPVMFAHPASAGHGLNLQDGGNIVVFFSVNWNLEEHLQIIERIGPTRQLQAGYDRPVFIYRIIAKDTVDELVLERLETKREVQDILMSAMKRRKADK